jgi:hypothetical protein
MVFLATFFKIIIIVIRKQTKKHSVGYNIEQFLRELFIRRSININTEIT